MWRHLGAGVGLAAVALLWIACAGDELLDMDIPYSCSSFDDCQEHGRFVFGFVCVDGFCVCPDGEELCCRPGSETRGPEGCERKCRPLSECQSPSCKTDLECPGPRDPTCGRGLCIDGLCALDLSERSERQRPGDCRVVKCDETGTTYPDINLEDAYNDGEPCTIEWCDDDGTPMQAPAPRGESPDGAGYCDGAGRWIGCLTTTDCGNQAYVCSGAGHCVLQWCADGNHDTILRETSVDCGGPCEPCDSGQPCGVPEDCRSQICDADSTCGRPTCKDGKHNGAETDTDCGGQGCDPCPDRLACKKHGDCQSGLCWTGTCRPLHCRDEVMNQSEIGIDCGTPCPPCPTE
jgi:hypothetical protein